MRIRQYLLTAVHPWQWAMLCLSVIAIGSRLSEWPMAYGILKPLPLVAAMMLVWLRHRIRPAPAYLWLLAALFTSAVGDICLLHPHLFTLGLIAFLSAHVLYSVLFTRDTPWLPRRSFLWLFGTVSALTYAFLWFNGLPAPMRWPVAAYIAVIMLMVTQAWGRAQVQGTRSAYEVALGALLFMASDFLLAINRFVLPFPGSALAVLGTYYTAQWLIVHGMLQALSATKLAQTGKQK